MYVVSFLFTNHMFAFTLVVYTWELIISEIIILWLTNKHTFTDLDKQSNIFKNAQPIPDALRPHLVTAAELALYQNMYICGHNVGAMPRRHTAGTMVKATTRKQLAAR